MATELYNPKRTIGHSDMGSVFKSDHYQSAVKEAVPVQSMGNTGISFANHMIETYLGGSKHGCFTLDHGTAMKR